MSGHNKFSKIKHLKAKNDAQKSKIFGKMVKIISLEAKKANGVLTSPGLASAIERAKKENVPNDTIDRAIKKAMADNSAQLESIIYECYGPGGVAILIEALTDNRNKASQEIKHVLSKNGFDLASPGSASWAFTKVGNEWQPTSTLPLGDSDIENLQKLVEELESSDEVNEIYTNAE